MEIKFRAFENGKMYHSNNNKDCYELGGKPGNSMISVFFNRFFGHETLGQFTGIKDRNEKDIYQGDICTVYSFDKFYRNAICIWDNQNGMYRLKVIKHDFIDITYLYYASHGYGRSIEVIGNIYENPELIQNETI